MKVERCDFMKKLISLLIVLCLIFGCFSMFSVSATDLTNVEDLITVEKAFPCNVFGSVFEFSKENYLEDLSSPPDKFSFDEQGNINYSFERSTELSTMYFKVTNEQDMLFKLIDNCRKEGVLLIDPSNPIPTVERIRLFFNTDIESKNLLGTSNVHLNFKFIYDDDTFSNVRDELVQTIDGNKKEINILSSFLKLNTEKTIKYICLEIENFNNENLSESNGFISALKCHFSVAEHKITIVGEKAGTCTEHGLLGAQYCEECNTYLTTNTPIGLNSDNHINIHIQIAKEPTCTEDGYTEGKYCLDCKKYIEEPTVINAIGHSFKAFSSQKPTYVAKGKKTLKCKYCGETEIKSIAKLKLKTPKFKLVKGKSKFKVKYTKVKDATGFQVRYKLGKGKWKTVKVTTKKSMTKTIKNLKKGKYTVRIRSLITQNKKTAYSSWSNSKTITVK